MIREGRLIAGILKAVLVLQRPVVPKAVKESLVSALDLVQPARFLREVALGEKILKLLTKILEQHGVPAVHAERVCRAGRCERCLNPRS